MLTNFTYKPFKFIMQTSKFEHDASMTNFQEFSNSTHLNRLGIFSDHFSIHFLTRSCRRGRFRELHVANAAVLFRLFVFDYPDIFDAAEMLKCSPHVVWRMFFTTNYKDSRKWGVVYVYTAWNGASIHGLLVIRSHFESLKAA